MTSLQLTKEYFSKYYREVYVYIQDCVKKIVLESRFMFVHPILIFQ